MMLQLGLSAFYFSESIEISNSVQYPFHTTLTGQYDWNYQDHFLQDTPWFLTIVLSNLNYWRCGELPAEEIFHKSVAGQQLDMRHTVRCPQITIFPFSSERIVQSLNASIVRMYFGLRKGLTIHVG